jgi:hypothetical protein
MVALAAALAPLAPAAAYDVLGSPGFPENHLPGVCCLEPTPDGFVATLCGLYAREYVGVDDSGHMHVPGVPSRPRVEFSTKTGWRWLDPVAPTSECQLRRPGGASDTAYQEGQRLAPGCPAALAAALPVLSQKDATRLRRDVDGGHAAGKQEVGTCLDHGGYVWFGLAFYDGEGYTGVGGLGRFDPSTGRVELRRPPLLRDWSAGALAHDGKNLWLATWRYGEGGDEPAVGFVRYDWDRDRLVPEPDAMCGFLVTGVAVVDGVLWVASDGGLSRRRADGRWEHLAFRVGEKPAVQRTTCRREWERARATVSPRYQAGFDEHVKEYRRRAAGAARSR